MEKKCLNKVCFGHGFRKVDPSISAVGFNPSLREKEIAVEIDPVSKFCIEVTGEGEDKCYRYRSDISMLLHAKDTANKIGIEGLRYLSESRRTKTSAIQSQLDQMDDQLLLDTVKSRHLQSPADTLSNIDWYKLTPEYRNWLQTAGSIVTGKQIGRAHV